MSENYQNYEVGQTLIFSGIESKTLNKVRIILTIKEISHNGGYKYYKFNDKSIWNTNLSYTTIATRWQKGDQNNISRQNYPFYRLLIIPSSSTIIIDNITEEITGGK